MQVITELPLYLCYWDSQLCLSQLLHSNELEAEERELVVEKLGNDIKCVRAENEDAKRKLEEQIKDCDDRETDLCKQMEVAKAKLGGAKKAKLENNGASSS